ncbi:MAG: cell division protein FtsZ [Bacteroidales bacterium]|nr:cell division protein FtsZ [Bacteroidales bacterium]
MQDTNQDISFNIEFKPAGNQASIIKVFGVGGGGSNAVNHMYRQGIRGVDFMICNTDAQALENSPVPNKLQIGYNLTEGRGAGNIPDVGKEAAEESRKEIEEVLSKNTKMVFITAGMGGGTGTGAAPVIAEIAKEMDILTVGIVTMPFKFEGNKRRLQAQLGIEAIRENVDSLLIINNDKVREFYGNLKLTEAFAKADDILAIAAKGISELITVTGYINVDFEDVKTVMKDSGVAIMGIGMAEGENRALTAVEDALNSPLLNDSEITGAENILLYIASGSDEITMDEVTEISDYIQDAAGASAEIIWGNGTDEALGAAISVTVVATNFNARPIEEMSNTRIVELEAENKEESMQEEQQMTVIDRSMSENVINPPELPKEPVREKITINLTDEDESVVNEHKMETEDFFSDHLSEEMQDSYFPKSEPEETFEPQEQESLHSKQQERIQTLKDFNFKIQSPEEMEEMEQKPAYERRGVILKEEIPSDEKVVSRFTLSENGEKKVEIKGNNSFLHDNVD